MTGDGARDGSNPTAFAAERDDDEKVDFPRLDQEMSPLLASVGAFAREEEAEIGTYAANTSHALSDVARESAVQKILALQSRERAERATPVDAKAAPAVANSAGVDAPAVAEDAHAGAPVSTKGAHAGAPVAPERGVPRRSRLKNRLLAIAGGSVAVALVLTLWFNATPGELPLPAYSIAARGGIKQARGLTTDSADDAGSVAQQQRLEPESLLIVAARPETAVTGTVAARAFVIQGNDANEVAANAQVAPTGAIELRFRGADLIGDRHGAASLRVLVGRPEALRTLPARAPLSPPAPEDARWRVLTVPLDLPAR